MLAAIIAGLLLAASFASKHWHNAADLADVHPASDSNYLVPELVVQDRQGMDELKREVLRGRALLHPGIVRTHNFAREAASAAIVMEFVDGKNLADLKRQQPEECFEAVEVRPWLEQVCAVGGRQVTVIGSGEPGS